MHDHLKLFREYADLESRRCAQGLTPLEYQRWLDLECRHRAKFREMRAGAARAGARPPRSAKTVMRVEYETPEALCDSYITNLSRGGVFVRTPFAAEIGTELVLRIHVEASGEVYEAAGVVVSNNVDGDFSTRNLGMGIHFDSSASQTRRALDELLASVADG